MFQGHCHSFICVDMSVLHIWFLQQDVSCRALTEAPPLTCGISVSDFVSTLDSVSLTVVTPGHNCSFTLTSPDSGGDGAECRRRGGGKAINTNETGGGRKRGEELKIYVANDTLGVEDGSGEVGGDAFICTLDELEAGTSYELQVQSQRDEAAANITVCTSKP